MQAFHPDKKAQKFLYFIALTVVSASGFPAAT
jgi:hypothetical protein